MQYLITFAIVALIIVSLWKIYTKAGQPGWAAIIPIYNVLILLKIIGRPWWWLLLLFIPIANIVVACMLAVGLAKTFGKGVGFAVGMVLLGIIFYPILAFGSATYTAPAAQA